MKRISAQKAKELQAKGYVFKPHNLYQNENHAVLCMLGGMYAKPYQVSLNGKPVKTATLDNV